MELLAIIGDLFTPVRLALLVICFTILLVWTCRHDNRYPPCPCRPWPILGHLPYMDPNFRKQFREWREQFGDAFTVYMGRQMVVVLNGPDMVKEAFINKGDEFMDRISVFIDKALNSINKGLGTSAEPVWRENRTTTVQILRSFGMGSNVIAERIEEEIGHYIDALDKLNGEPTDIRPLLRVNAANIICSIVIGHRFEYEDEDFIKTCSLVHELFKPGPAENTSLLNFFPFLQYLPGDICGANRLKIVGRDLMELFGNRYLAESEAAQLAGKENYIAAYMHEMRTRQASGDPTLLDRPNLLRCIVDLFAAGTETTSTTITWCVLYMLYHPDIQEKIFREIESEIGLARTPTMADKNKLIYLNAVIMETQRRAGVVPLAIPRIVKKDTVLGKYLIPKGSQILVNIDSVLHDEATWGKDALEFRPERCIGQDGNLVSVDAWIPYSLGKRNCAGEPLARMELFLNLATMIQRFKFLPEDSEHLPSLNETLGMACTPEPFKVRVVKRN